MPDLLKLVFKNQTALEQRLEHVEQSVKRLVTHHNPLLPRTEMEERLITKKRSSDSIYPKENEKQKANTKSSLKKKKKIGNSLSSDDEIKVPVRVKEWVKDKQWGWIWEGGHFTLKEEDKRYLFRHFELRSEVYKASKKYVFISFYFHIYSLLVDSCHTQ